MATKTGTTGGMQVDTALVRELADMLAETGLSEIEVEDGDRKIRVARKAAQVAATPMHYAAAPAPAGIGLHDCRILAGQYCRYADDAISQCKNRLADSPRDDRRILLNRVTADTTGAAGATHRGEPSGGFALVVIGAVLRLRQRARAVQSDVNHSAAGTVTDGENGGQRR